MRQIQHAFLPFLLLFTMVACSAEAISGTDDTQEHTASATDAGDTALVDNSAATGTDEEVARPAGWTEASHSNDAAPNYDIVFPDDKVNQITITIDPADWEAMQADMTEILGEPGAGRGRAPSVDEMGQPDGQPPSRDSRPGGGMAGAIDLVSETPLWVPATIEFDGMTWNHVGVRYKGNSSLRDAWNKESLKMPFKFDFDEFEDDYPEIDNQRFFGFKQLSLANGFSDDTYLRETITYDVMREAGLVASRTALYNVILDYGEGPVNLGIYTVVEVVDDTVIDNAFGDDSGNLYEGDGVGVSLAKGVYDLIADSFEKENNEDEADWGDIEALYHVLHAGTRTTDSEQWRADLEGVFEVDTFLNWLAVSAVVRNWDTYGAMAHNFYLYNNPDTGQLVWIPWDHNMTLSAGGERERNMRGDRGGMNRSTSFDKEDIDNTWPLIRFLLDDPVYRESYMGYLAAASERFDAGELNARIEAMAGMVRPFIAAGEEARFRSAVRLLIAVVSDQDAAVADFLAGR